MKLVQLFSRLIQKTSQRDRKYMPNKMKKKKHSSRCEVMKKIKLKIIGVVRSDFCSDHLNVGQLI